jgi:hypothetical protein
MPDDFEKMIELLKVELAAEADELYRLIVEANRKHIEALCSLRDKLEKTK